jgi:hypothetical protein
MQLKVLRCLALIGVIALVFSGVAKADLLSGCDTCQGSTYQLTYDPTPVGTFTINKKMGNIYDVFLTINPTDFVSSQMPPPSFQIYIQAVAIKLASQNNFSFESLVAAPGGSSKWSLVSGGISNSGGTAGCSGSGGGFLCAQDDKTAPVPFTGTYTWEFHYATTKALLTGTLNSTVEVAYTDGSSKKVGSLMGNGITLQAHVPDGGLTLMLLGSALLGIETLRRRLHV